MKTLLKKRPLPSSKGLVAHWKLYEGTVFDYSLNNGAGILVNTPVPVYPGFQFTVASSQSINFGDILPLGTGDFSFSGWIKTTILNANPIISKMSTVVDWWRIAVQTGKIASDFDVDPDKKSMLGSTIVNDDAWHFFTVTREAGVGMKLYVDGQAAEDTVADPGNLTTGNSSDVFIGHAEDPNDFFDGLIDDIRVFNIALSVEEILSLYSLTKWRYSV